MLQICQNIRRERDLKGFTQQEMADKLKVERATYKNWEDKTEPNLSMIKTIAQELEIPAWKLLKGVIDFTEKERARPDVKIEKILTAEQADAVLVSLDVLGSVFSPGVLKEQGNKESVPLGNKTFRRSGEKKGKRKDIS